MNKMYFKRFSFYLFIILIFCICIGYSQDNTKYSDNLSFIDISIRFYNKQIYYKGDPIIIEFQIVNNGSAPFLFITSYNKIFTFDFDISTLSNRKVEHSKDYTIQRRKVQPILNDEITLKQNEVYGVRINISEWFDFKEHGEYIVKGIFYPNLITDTGKKLLSEKELYLNLNPPYTEVLREKIRVEEIKKLKAESLPPYKVIDFILQALIDKDFEKYFLYIKMEKFIMQFENAKKKYLDARDTDKPEVLDIFKQYLKGENTLESIPFSDTIPTNYEIEETLIKKRDARVIVIEFFEYGLVTEAKKYTYHLHLYGDKWLVENYDVVNI
ncbi:hypothetical protein ES703_91675 [subsurface metagenome]